MADIIILARSGSKRIPKKNYLVELTPGQSLLSLCIKKGLRISNKVTVSSDSELVLKLAKDEGAKTILSPYHNDDSTSVDAVLFWAQERGTTGPILLLQLTSPLVEVEEIERAIDEFDGQPIFAASEMKRGFQIWNLNHALFPEFQGVRSQDLPTAFLPCGAFYITTERVLEERKSFMDGARPFGIAEERAIDIDTPEDLEFARWKFLQTWNPEH